MLCEPLPVWLELIPERSLSEGFALLPEELVPYELPVPAAVPVPCEPLVPLLTPLLRSLALDPAAALLPALAPSSVLQFGISKAADPNALT
ncbi:MAG TPA: hypothetical protein VKE49_09390 [Myxococcaceae bacterium]|nr:hypothetical protein [Myxococcaceae bacterium]